MDTEAEDPKIDHPIRELDKFCPKTVSSDDCAVMKSTFLRFWQAPRHVSHRPTHVSHEGHKNCAQLVARSHQMAIVFVFMGACNVIPGLSTAKMATLPRGR